MHKNLDQDDNGKQDIDPAPGNLDSALQQRSTQRSDSSFQPADLRLIEEAQAALDDQLSKRAQDHSSLPWIATRIESQLSARTQARVWLRRCRWSLGSVPVMPQELLAYPRLLAFVGSAVAGGAIGYLAVASITTAHVALICGLLTAAISSVGSLWSNLKDFYY